MASSPETIMSRIETIPIGNGILFFFTGKMSGCDAQVSADGFPPVSTIDLSLHNPELPRPINKCP